MGQSSYVYILWLVILGAGLWIIIGFGSTMLSAREDLAGEWQLTPAHSTRENDSLKMKVEQSGRYFKVTLPGGNSVNMTMIEETVTEQRLGEHKRIVLRGGKSEATFEGLTHGDLWRLSLDGTHYVARLTERMYPRPKPATRPSSPHASIHGGATPRVPAPEVTLQTETRGVVPP